MTRTIQEAQDINIARFLRDGPRLTSSYNIFVVARDRKRGKVLLGGLGPMGVGQMWGKEKESYYARCLGFKNAPEQESI